MAWSLLVKMFLCLAEHWKKLERIMSAEGNRMDLANTAAVRALKNKQPGTVSELRALLGLSK